MHDIADQHKLEERSKIIRERKRSLQQAEHEKLQKKVIRELSQAEERRITQVKHILEKVRSHNNKVKEVAEHHQQLEEESAAKQRERLRSKIENATKARERTLEKRINTAQLSAKKRGKGKKEKFIVVEGQEGKD